MLSLVTLWELMGNKIGRKRQVIDERYTKPQGLYPSKDIDHKKLRKLILEYKLAPCYPGEEEYAFDLEECPICFLYYPSLNRSRCCTKSICTECFLQMKPPQATRPTQCPFCKTAKYAVEYRGVKTKEEKGLEQVEEQKVIEAKIRIRQKELQDEAERTNKVRDSSSSSRTMALGQLDCVNLSSASCPVPYPKCIRQMNDHLPAEASCSSLTSTRPSHSRQNRQDDFDLDLEDIMVMEAIWLSIQEEANQGNPVCFGSHFPGPSSEGYYNSQVMVPVKVSPSGGLACAAAALAERQLMNGEAAGNAIGSGVSAYEMLHQPGNMPAANVRFGQSNPSGRWIATQLDDGRELTREEYGECSTDQWSEAAEAGTSYAGSDVMLDPGAAPVPFPDVASMGPGQYVPESFEEQMMLAMAVSLAEARGRFGNQGLSWL